MVIRRLRDLCPDAGRWWLVCILVFLPFQHVVFKITRLWSDSRFIDQLDEITIIVFTFFAVRRLYKGKTLFSHQYLFILLPVVAIVVAGFISGMVNGNYFVVTLHGVFDYVKYFFVIFIYAAFFKGYKDFKKTFNLLIAVAVFMGAIAFIQEAWALSSRYIFQKNIDEIFYLDIGHLINPPRSNYSEDIWRFGMIRTHSLMINANFLGLYILLILAIYSQITEKINLAVFISFFSGILGSVSRVVYTCFVLIGSIQILRGRKWWLTSLIPVLVILFYLSPLPEYLKSSSLPKKQNAGLSEIEKTEEKKKSWDSYRYHAREKAIEIWKDHILLGAGPGMYGGGISLKYNSPLYEKYKFDPYRFDSLKKWKTIDQFWFQMLAEIGVVGVACYIMFIVFLSLTMHELKKKASSGEIRGLFTGLLISIISLLVSTFGYSLTPPIAFTFFAIVGMSLVVTPEAGENED